MEVIIKSTIDGKWLRFHEIEGDYFQVSIGGNGPHATKKIWGYTDADWITDLFESCAKDWKGWTDDRSWSSIEGDLTMEIFSSTLGQVTIRVYIRDSGRSEDWKVEVPIFTEVGALENIAMQCRNFFGAREG